MTHGKVSNVSPWLKYSMDNLIRLGICVTFEHFLLEKKLTQIIFDVWIYFESKQAESDYFCPKCILDYMTWKNTFALQKVFFNNSLRSIFSIYSNIYNHQMKIKGNYFRDTKCSEGNLILAKSICRKEKLFLRSYYL